MNWCILIPIIVGLICALLGYLLGKASAGSNEVISNTGDLDALRSRNTKLEADLVACNGRVSSLKASAATMAVAPVVAASSVSAYDGERAKAVFGKRIKEDDLKVVEGIGPKIEQLFKADGLETWRKLSEASYDRCKKILDDAGDSYRMHNPATWPKQAGLAADGKWEALKKWQDELDGGK